MLTSALAAHLRHALYVSTGSGGEWRCHFSLKRPCRTSSDERRQNR